jgi:hypothetical protein
MAAPRHVTPNSGEKGIVVLAFVDASKDVVIPMFRFARAQRPACGMSGS